MSALRSAGDDSTASANASTWCERTERVSNWFRVVVAVGYLMVHASCAFAQEAAEEEPAGRGWVISYILVIMGIGLGLMVVCRTGTRRSDIRADDTIEED